MSIIRVTLAMLLSATVLHAQSASVAIRNVGIVDVTDGKVQPSQTVLIEGNRIVAIGRIVVPTGARILDGTGAFLIPGLWDMHVHATNDQEDVAAFFPLFIANGVTGIRDTWGNLDVAANAQAEVVAGTLAGPPRIVAAGALIDGPAHIWPTSLIAITPADGVRLADSLYATHAPFLKVYSSLLPATFFAIAERARAVGIPFVGHVPELVTTAAASNAGMRSVEHLTGIAKGCSSNEDSIIAYFAREVRALLANDTTRTVADVFMERDRRILASQDTLRCRALAALLARNQTWQVPTLVTNRGYAMMREMAAAGDERLRYMPKGLQAFWMPKTNRFASTMSAAAWEVQEAMYLRMLQFIPWRRRACQSWPAPTRPIHGHSRDSASTTSCNCL